MFYSKILACLATTSGALLMLVGALMVPANAPVWGSLSVITDQNNAQCKSQCNHCGESEDQPTGDPICVVSSTPAANLGGAGVDADPVLGHCETNVQGGNLPCHGCSGDCKSIHVGGEATCVCERT